MKILIFILVTLTSYAKILDSYQLFNVQTVEVTERNITETKSYYGRLAYDEANIVEVSARFEGYVEKLMVDKDYQEVHKGEVLALIYSPVISAVQGELIASLKKTINKNNRLYHIAVRKLRQYGISSKTIDKISKTKKVMDLVPIHSPVDGIVLKRNVFVGSAFKTSQTLFQLVSLKTMAVNIEIYQKDFEMLQVGQELTIEIEGCSNSFQSVIQRIYPMVDQKTQTFIARASITPKERLYDGMFLKASVMLKHQEILFLPANSVAIKGERYIVFVAGEFEGEFEPRMIQANKVHGGYEVLSGLRKGDKVVKNALFLLDADAQFEGTL